MSEQGRFPLTEKDLERIGIYTRMAGLESLTRWEEKKRLALALFVVYRLEGTPEGTPELGVCFRCPCNLSNCWIGKVCNDKLGPSEASIHMTGENCDSPGYKRKAVRLPLGILTEEVQGALVAAHPRFKTLSELFEEVNKTGRK